MSTNRSKMNSLDEKTSYGTLNMNSESGKCAKTLRKQKERKIGSFLQLLLIRAQPECALNINKSF